MNDRTESFAPPRRVVTGHDAMGRSVVLSDERAPKSHSIPGATFHELWSTSETPAPLFPAEQREPTERPLVTSPPSTGTTIRFVDMEPGSRSPMHRTESVDYGIVIAGNIELLLDDGSVTRLGPGDVVVQRGTAHAWLETGDETVRMAFILIDGRFSEELLSCLPADVSLFDRVLDD